MDFYLTIANYFTDLSDSIYVLIHIFFMRNVHLLVTTLP